MNMAFYNGFFPLSRAQVTMNSLTDIVSMRDLAKTKKGDPHSLPSPLLLKLSYLTTTKMPAKRPMQTPVGSKGPP